MKKYGKPAYKKRNYRRRRGTSTRKGRTVSTAVRSYVRRAIHSNLEQKKNIYYANFSISSGATTAVPHAVSLFPTNIAQGTGESQRIGNVINLRSGYIRGRIYLNPYNVTTNPKPSPLLVKMFLVSCKPTHSPSLTQPATFATFFNVNNSGVNFQSTLLDMHLPVNDKFWTLHASKIVMLGVNNASASYPTANCVFGGGSFSVPFYFSLRKHTGMLKYDDGGINPTNKNLILIFQPVYADNTNTATYLPCSVSYTIENTYEDA